MHRGQVGAAVQAGEVGGGRPVALAVGGGLGVSHGVGRGALHAGRVGGRQRVGQRRDGGRAPDGHGGAGAAGAGRDGGAGWRRRGAVGPIGAVVGLCVLIAGRRGLLLGWPRLGLAAALLLLLTALGPPVLEPHLSEQDTQGFINGLISGSYSTLRWGMNCCRPISRTNGQSHSVCGQTKLVIVLQCGLVDFLLIKKCPYYTYTDNVMFFSNKFILSHATSPNPCQTKLQNYIATTTI